MPLGVDDPEDHHAEASSTTGSWARGRTPARPPCPPRRSSTRTRGPSPWCPGRRTGGPRGAGPRSIRAENDLISVGPMIARGPSYRNVRSTPDAWDFPDLDRPAFRGFGGTLDVARDVGDADVVGRLDALAGRDRRVITERRARTRRRGLGERHRKPRPVRSRGGRGQKTPGTTRRVAAMSPSDCQRDSLMLCQLQGDDSHCGPCGGNCSLRLGGRRLAGRSSSSRLHPCKARMAMLRMVDRRLPRLAAAFGFNGVAVSRIRNTFRVTASEQDVAQPLERDRLPAGERLGVERRRRGGPRTGSGRRPSRSPSAALAAGCRRVATGSTPAPRFASIWSETSTSRLGRSTIRRWTLK